MVHREHRLSTDLEIGADPDHAGINRSDCDGAVAEIVGDGRRELRLNNRNQMIDEVRKLVIVNLRFQIGHAVLNGSAVGQYLWNEDVLVDVK